MQENFIFKLTSLFAFLASILCLCACSEKTPEQIAAENAKKTDIAVRRSKVFLFDEKPKMAISMLESTYSECGPSAQLCEALADSYAQDNQLASAAMFYDRAAELKDNNPDLRINAAKCYEQSGVYDSAVKAYENYLKAKPQDMVAWKALAKCYENQEKYSEALNAYLSALKAAGRNPTSSEAASIGNMFAKVGNAPQARRWLEAAFSATLPDNVETRKEILSGLLSVYLAQKETNLVKATVEELDKIDANLVKEKYPKLHAQLEEFYKTLREAEESLKAENLKKEAEAKEKAEEAKKLAEEKSKKEAEEAKAKKKAEEEAKLAAENAKKAEDAAKTSPTQDTADTQQPAQFSAITEGQIQDANIKDETSAKTPKALSTYDEFVADCYDKIAKSDFAAAEKSAHQAIYQNRTPGEAWRALAKAYEAAGKYPDCFMAAREAYVRDPDDINATLYYLRSASRVQNNEKFLNSLYRAHEKFPNNAEILVGLARTYKVIGDMRNAKYFYNYFLNTTPKEHPLYKEMYDEFEELLANNHGENKAK